MITLHSTGIYPVVKIKGEHKLQHDFTIRDQMANLGRLLVCPFGNIVETILVAVHTVYDLDLDNKQSFEN